MEKEWFASWFDTSYYHVLYQNRNDEEANEFIDNVVNEIQLSENSEVLDLACGAGRHARMLKNHYSKVLGVDLSPNSIETAKENKLTNLDFQVHDMRDEIQGKKFNGIFNLFTSFGYFDSTDDNVKMLKSIHEMLLPGGVLVIDFMNASKVIKNLVQEETKTLDGITFNIKRSFDGNHIYKNIQFSADNQDWDFTERVQGINKNGFKQLLKQANFEILNTFGDYQLSSFDVENSNRLIIIAKKN